jgi:hypothetical protein
MACAQLDHWPKNLEHKSLGALIFSPIDDGTAEPL